MVKHDRLLPTMTARMLAGMKGLSDRIVMSPLL